jgi:hypothetical protein
MANVLKGQRIIDGNKRALIKYVFLSDGTAVANSTLVDASSLAFALNTNGYIMSSNVDPKTSYRTTIKRIFGNAKVNSYITIQWAGTSNAEIVTIGSGSFDYDFQSMGDGAIIPMESDATTGDILLSINNNKNNDAFTLFIDLRKNNEDFDAGQTADPYAFNKKGPFP